MLLHRRKSAFLRYIVMATTPLSSRHCHLLEDLVLGVSFYCLALFDEIEDKMNEKTYSPRECGNGYCSQALRIPPQIMNTVSNTNT